MKPTLVILAAGMGSRYGKLKQMDAFGPNGETIIDYSIYDAINAGFGKIVFIIRDFFREEFQSTFDKKFGDKIKLEYVNQELTTIPDGYEIHEDRQKPWGTAHAVWVAHEVVKEPFAVINADDFYGAESYKVLFDYLTGEDDKNYAVVGYKLKNTLSDNGTVNRGVCYSDDNGNLSTVVECTKIARNADGSVSYPGENDEATELDENALVSMNMWAFRPSYFDFFNEEFGNFLKEKGMVLKSEFYIPSLVDKIINEGNLDVKLLTTNSDWFGVTYIDDKPVVMEKLQSLIDAGEYPNNIY